MSIVDVIGLAANVTSMAILARERLRAIPFNHLLLTLVIFDTVFLVCNSLSCLHALGINNGKWTESFKMEISSG